MLTISHTVLEGGSPHDWFEVVAELGVVPVERRGDGRYEPREPAHAETHIRAMRLMRTRGVVTTIAIVDCPDWLAALIVEDTQDEADRLAREYLEEEAA